MKRSMKIAAIILSISVFAAVLYLGQNEVFAVESQGDSATYELEGSTSDQRNALIAYEKLWNSFEKDDQGMPVYFEEYGGEYIDGSFLVLQIVGLNEEYEEKYLRICEDKEFVKFENVNNSLNYLQKYDELARELIDDYNLVSFCVDRKNNKYLIQVTEDDFEELCEEIQVRGLADIIEIESSAPAVTCATNVYGGDRIVNSSTGAYYSACIGGYYNGYEAILTAGHGNEGSPSFSRYSSHIGQVWKQRCNTLNNDTTVNSLGDFAIIVMGGNYIGTNKVRNATSVVSVTGYYSGAPVGTNIYKYGSMTGYSWGTIQQINVTVRYGLNQYYVRGLYQSYMQNSSGGNAVDQGDSGGCVYANDGSYKIVGNVSGYYRTDNGVNHIMYTSPIFFAVDSVNGGFSIKTN